MVTEDHLRSVVGRIMRRGVPDGTIEEVLAALERHVIWLEEAWQECHAEHTAQERLAALQRLRQEEGQVVTGDPAGEVAVTALIGAGHIFSQPADYHLALEWAVRSYRAGQVGHTVADEFAVEAV